MQFDKDTLNIPLTECKDLILEYQKTRKPETFHYLLGKFDKYLVYLVHKFSNNYWCLRAEEPQELYHISIIGFHKGLLSLRPEWNPEGIFLWVGSYIKHHLTRAYSYKTYESSLNDRAIQGLFNDNKDSFKERNSQYDKFVSKVDWSMIMGSDILTEDEKDYLRLKYVEDLYLKEIAKIKGTTYGMVSYTLNKILNKLRTILLKESGDEGEDKSSENLEYKPKN